MRPVTGAVGHECIEVGAGEAVRPYDHIEGPVPQIDDGKRDCLLSWLLNKISTVDVQKSGLKGR